MTCGWPLYYFTRFRTSNKSIFACEGFQRRRDCQIENYFLLRNWFLFGCEFLFCATCAFICGSSSCFFVSTAESIDMENQLFIIIKRRKKREKLAQLWPKNLIPLGPLWRYFLHSWNSPPKILPAFLSFFFFNIYFVQFQFISYNFWGAIVFVAQFFWPDHP